MRSELKGHGAVLGEIEACRKGERCFVQRICEALGITEGILYEEERGGRVLRRRNASDELEDRRSYGSYLWGS